MFEGENTKLNRHVVMVPSADLSTLTIIKTYAITVKGVVRSSSRNAINLYTQSRDESRVDDVVGVRN